MKAWPAPGRIVLISRYAISTFLQLAGFLASEIRNGNTGSWEFQQYVANRLKDGRLSGFSYDAARHFVLVTALRKRDRYSLDILTKLELTGYALFNERQREKWAREANKLGYAELERRIRKRFG